jgi:hypothetical protein
MKSGMGPGTPDGGVDGSGFTPQPDATLIAERSEHFIDLGCRDRPTDQEALDALALNQANELQLIFILNSLGDDR